MSDVSTLSKPLPSNGVKGLIIMAPVVGFPLVLHAVGGAVVTGLGVAAFSALLSPYAEKVFQTDKEKSGRHPLASRYARMNSSDTELIPVRITVKGFESE